MKTEEILKNRFTLRISPNFCRLKTMNAGCGIKIENVLLFSLSEVTLNERAKQVSHSAGGWGCRAIPWKILLT